MQIFRSLSQRTDLPVPAARADATVEARQAAIDRPMEPVDVDPTPIYISQRVRLVIIAAAILAIIWLFSLAPNVLRLLLIGATVALVLSFPVRLIERWLPRNLAILTVVGSTVAMAVVGLILLVPYGISEISNFVQQLPAISDTVEAEIRNTLMQFYRRGWIDRHPDVLIDEAQGTLLSRGEVIIERLLNNAVEALTRSFSIAITTFGVIFVATYLLIDIPKFKNKFILSFSPVYRPDATQLWLTIGDSLSRYLGGLVVSILIQGGLATAAMFALGIPYAIVLGVWMSITAILPYVGAFLGAIPAILVAMTISWKMAVIVALVYIGINQIEGNLITPRIQGTAVRVHPLLIFVAVIGGSQVAGPLGAILAVPSLAIVRVLAEFLWVRLQVPESQATDTVLVALGGDDDDDGEEDITIVESGDDDRDVSVSRASDGDITIRVDDDDDAQKVTTGFRRRPSVKRRTAPRRHRTLPTA
jgi:predicted PurR-regulated permease PerM